MELNLGLVAKDMRRSVLPTAYEFLGEKIGFDVSFELCNVPESALKATLERLRHTLHGFTVTMPYKVKVLEYCDELDESAEKCGSANTILVQNGKLKGYNTDGWGMIKCLSLKGIDLSGKRVTMVGAGGVALSIAYYLSVNGVKDVRVLNIFPDETDRLLTKMGPLFTGYMLNEENLESCARGAECFINASVLGQVGYDDYGCTDFLDRLPSDAIVFDVNYSNPDAVLPRTAREKGLRTFTGKTMSSCQGILAMQIWTGRTVSDETARELVRLVETD